MRKHMAKALIAALALSLALPGMAAKANTISKGTEVNGNYIELRYAADGNAKINEKEVKEGDLISDGPTRTYVIGGNYNMKYDSGRGWDTNIKPRVRTMVGNADSNATIYTKVVRTNRDGDDLSDGTGYVSASIENDRLYIRMKSDLSTETKDKLKKNPAYFTVVFSTIDITADKMVDFKGIQVNFANRKNSKDFTASQSDLNTDFAQVNFQIGETYTSGSTEITNCATPDGLITSAKVKMNSDGTVTLKEVSSTDKKDKMDGMDLNLSTIIVGGIERDVRDIDDNALKSAKMASIKADHVRTIGDNAFRSCKKLKKVEMKETALREIGTEAFRYCSKLKNFKFNGKKLTTVGSNSFSDIKKGCVIKIGAEKAKYNKDMNLFKNSGINKVKFSRFNVEDDDDEDDDDDDDD